jgi:hypothetical protein
VSRRQTVIPIPKVVYNDNHHQTYFDIKEGSFQSYRY